MPPKHSQLRKTHVLYVLLFVALATLQAIGVGFFTKGFLLLRPVLATRASCGADSAQCVAPRFRRAVVLVIDALRFDFAIPVEGSLEPYHNNLRVLHELAAASPEQSLLLKFIADAPTTTLQRLKGLTTGSLPTFVDAGSNFDGAVVEEDNWVSQLFHAGRRVAFAGDDTWAALFGPYLAPNMSFPFPSLDVWDLDTVDAGVEAHLFPLLAAPASWDVLVGHFLGVDHVGHRHGPQHPAMRAKQRQMDRVVREVVAALDDETLLVVMGDHGMTHTGDHGGDSANECEAAVFFHAARPFVQPRAAADYDVGAAGRRHRAVNQIDLVPSLSLLLGLPVPFNNLGSPIDELFGPALPRAHRLVSQQIAAYREATEALRHDDAANAMGAQVLAMTESDEGYADAARAYQQRLLAHCRGLWARFDLQLIGLGVAITAAAALLLLLVARLVPSVVVTQMAGEVATSIAAVLPLGVVALGAVHAVLQPDNLSLAGAALLGVAAAVVLGFLAPITDRYLLVWLLHQARDFRDAWSLFGALCVLLHALAFASNSFTVWEDRLVSFLLLTFGVLCAVAGGRARGAARATRAATVSHALVFLLLTRAAAAITACREEQGTHCHPTFAMLWWSVAALYAVAAVLPRAVRGFLETTASYRAAAPRWVGACFTAVLLLHAVYWTMELAETEPRLVALLPHALALQTAKLVVARAALGGATVAATLGYARGPLCFQVHLGPRRRATILGYGNVYGASYLLFALSVTCATMLVAKPLAALSLCLLVVQLLTLLELFDRLELRKSLVAPVVFGLLAASHFFSTGHQATLSSIQWELGFIVTRSITMPFTHLTIYLNTFGSYAIVIAFLPLIVLWNIPPSTKPRALLGKVAQCCATFSMYQTTVTLGTLVSAAFFRRHLMVWKVFAPRFMAGAIVLVTTSLLVVVVYAFAVGIVVKRMNRIFGS